MIYKGSINASSNPTYEQKKLGIKMSGEKIY